MGNWQLLPEMQWLTSLLLNGACPKEWDFDKVYSGTFWDRH